MNVLYEEDGGFKVGAVLSDAGTSLQVEAPHGKRSRVKSANVLLRFDAPPLAGFMEQAERMAADMDLDFLWQCCGESEFGYDELGREYFGHPPAALEAAALLLRLHGAPMYFYKKGKGRYKAAPEDALKAALASVERKRQQALQQAQYVEQLGRGELPEAFRPLLDELLYAPDRNRLETKALEQAATALKLTPLRLLERCGAIPSSHDFHLRRFLREYFPAGTGFDFEPRIDPHPELPLAQARAFSIDDAATTEIDDALSVARLPAGGWRIGVHIAAPALGFGPGTAVDDEARRRQSTVYMPGDKITMLPEAVVERFTLAEDREVPAVSLYLELAPDLRMLGSETRVERIRVAANLRHATLDPVFDERAVALGRVDHEFGDELMLLWRLAGVLEAGRGKAETGPQAPDYSFHVEDGRITISERRRGSPIDKVVAELMIVANTTWGGMLAQAGIPAIYRAQAGGKVRMTTRPEPHQGLGVDQYAWSSSPLRRYVDLVNQRQIIAAAQGAAAPYKADALAEVMRGFEVAYEAYADFQRGMERYWCLRWLEQEGVTVSGATVLRESLVRLDRLPLVLRVPSLPQLAPGERVEVEIAAIDYLDLTVNARYRRQLAGEPETGAAA